MTRYERGLSRRYKKIAKAKQDLEDFQNNYKDKNRKYQDGETVRITNKFNRASFLAKIWLDSVTYEGKFLYYVHKLKEDGEPEHFRESEPWVYNFEKI